MVRKSKSETEQTRQDIITAARKIFAARGVSRSTLEQIANEAGVTRGAIYWHFKDKPDLFFAMMEQVSLPLIDHIDESMLANNLDDPLRNIEESMKEIVQLLQEDEIARTTFEIIHFKCEYVDEFTTLDNHAIKTRCNFMQILNRAYHSAHGKGLLRSGLDPALCALDSYTFIKGLVRLWISDIDGDIIRNQTTALISTHIAMRYP